MSITRDHFAPGATWTFVHATGRRTEYQYVNEIQPAVPSPDGRGLGLSAMHGLRNPETECFAMVSEKWMREGPVGSHSHWLPGEALKAAA